MIVTYYLQKRESIKSLKKRRQDTLVQDVQNEIILEGMVVSNFRIEGL